MKRNKSILEMEERVIYNPDNPSEMLDWMGYEIHDDNPMCFVEIMGDDREREGVALLSKDSRQILNRIKNEDEELYDNWLVSFSITDRRLADNNPEESLWQMIRELHAQTEIFEDDMNNNRKR